mmetsp:Transcript_49048/g.123391  ORF Transcript_49048/g.123391 Transcript_49048/m.123391 type:complete len:211 (-) Transcript_49048:260-892(-)
MVEGTNCRSSNPLPVRHTTEECSPGEVLPDDVEHVIQLTVAGDGVLVIVSEGESAVEVEGETLAKYLHVDRFEWCLGRLVEHTAHTMDRCVHLWNHLLEMIKADQTMKELASILPLGSILQEETLSTKEGFNQLEGGTTTGLLEMFGEQFLEHLWIRGQYGVARSTKKTEFQTIGTTVGLCQFGKGHPAFGKVKVQEIAEHPTRCGTREC